MDDYDSTPDTALLQYFDELERGASPDPDSLTSGLSHEARREFDETLGAVGWAKARLPRPMGRSSVVAHRYELLQELGSGGFGRVWRAWDRRLESEVAIKFIDAPASDDDVDREVHATELHALARVRCPGVARVLDSGREDDRIFIVLELIQGRSLECVLSDIRDRVPSGSVPAPGDLRIAIRFPTPCGSVDLVNERSWYRISARIVEQILRTLEAIHSAGILHRDIKPANVMLRGCGNPVLLDFGMAALKDERRGKVTERLGGSLAYLSPEQLRSHRTGDDARTDVYQAGLLLYELLTLRPAFDPIADRDVLALIRDGRFVPPRKRQRSIPGVLEDICLRALETNPERRYQTAEAFREDLVRWIDGRSAPVAARCGRLGAVCRDLRYAFRNHPRIASGALGFLVGACMSGVMLTT